MVRWDDQTIERCFQEMRMGRVAQELLQSANLHPGAVIDFPVWVTTYHEIDAERQQMRTWPLQPDQEPGSLFPVGVTPIRWNIRTIQECGTGVFYVVVRGMGDKRPPKVPEPTSKFWDANGKEIKTPAWASQIPTNIAVDQMSPQKIRQVLIQNVQKREQSRNEVLQVGKKIVFRAIERNRHRLQLTGASFDRDDALQQGWITMARLAEMFASNERPRCSWAHICTHQVYRDVQRTISRMNGESVNMAALRAWLWQNPEVHDVTSARAAGISDSFSDSMIEEAIFHRVGVVSLDSMHYRDEEGQGTQDHLSALGVEEPTLGEANLPATLQTLIEAAGMTVEQAAPWLYKIGAFDHPHPQSEVKAKYGLQTRQIAKIEERFFSHFILEGESWNNIKDRPKIRERARLALTANDSFLSSSGIRRAYED